MATHARMVDPKAAPDDGPLKNGTASLEDSDDSSNGVAAAKSRSPAAPPRDMDAFQDGGRPDYPQQQGYPPPQQFPPADEFRAPGDFDGGGGGYRGFEDKQPYRAPFPRQPRGAAYRFGPQQQTGPTPTLNQLLQAPNSLQPRYNSYPDYPNNSWGRPYRNQGGDLKRPYQQMSSPQQPQQQPYYNNAPPPRHPNQGVPPQQQQQYPGGPAYEAGPRPPYPTPPPPHTPQQDEEGEAPRPGSGSPSMSPGQPPRPSSAQSDNSGPPPQGYNQQMAPPSGMYGNKIQQNMMGPSSNVPPYSPSSHYPQGGGYQQQPPQQRGYAPQGGGGAWRPMMPPPPHQYKGNMPPPGTGAQAAAQAAVIAASAAASTSPATPGGPRQSPMYLRQHLQQKMYNSNYGDNAEFNSTGVPPQSISSPTPSPSDALTSRNSLQGPPIMDEGSQASNASASSSLAEERVETPKPLPPSSKVATLPSPGAASMSSFHDDFDSSPSWPRTPASPVINNQPYDHHPIKRPDGMLKLYEVSDEPERRLFLDRLIAYQEERGTPLSQCPTISKQPLDLYRLYLAAKERGGFVEVMKGKMWKEIAGLVGIGASSGAAYTLRKQYIKHLLPFECKFDRGGIDPVPLVSSLEAGSRKKNAAKAQPPAMMEYPGGPYPGYEQYPYQAEDPFEDPQRPPPPPEQYPPSYYPQQPPQEQPPYEQYPPPDPYAPPPGGYPPNRTVGPPNTTPQYPPYQNAPEQERFVDPAPVLRPSLPNNSQPDGYRYPPPRPPQYPPYAQQQDSYNRAPQGDFQQSYPPYNMPPPNKVAPPGSIPGYKREYATPNYPQQPPYSDRSQYSYRPNHTMPPQSAPPPSPQQGWPRPYGQQQYPQQRGEHTWEAWKRSPTKMTHPPQQSQAPHPAPPPQQQVQQQPSRRPELVFPPDTVEGVAPVSAKRRRLLAKDVSPVDPWRLMMALKSGLLGESTWALDTLSVLIHDDATVLYFGLSHLQGLLEVLMDHYRRCLNLVFDDLAADMELGGGTAATDPQPTREWYELEGDAPLRTEPGPPEEDDEKKGGRLELLCDAPNYTHRTRCRKPVRVAQDDPPPLFLFDPGRRWDTHEGFISGSSHWQHGGGEATHHIQTHFEPTEAAKVRFVRLLRPTAKKGDDPAAEEEEAKTEEETTTKEDEKPQDDSRLRRRRRADEADLEDEAQARDEPSLCTTTEAQDSLARRCVAASSILRNLSFVPGNDSEMSKHAGFLLVLGRLLLLHHAHHPRRPPQRHYDRDEDAQGDEANAPAGPGEWWWDALHAIRENTLVTLANISGQLDLAPFPEEISFPLLDGLLHWATCPSSRARDPLPHSVLSPQRLSLEALAKLSVLESNVDLMMATPPWSRADRLLALLARWLGRNEDQVLREFSVVLLSNLAQADSAVARAIALQAPCIPLLLTFVEQAEQSALQVANSQGVHALRENPELMGTTLDMVRRAAGTLRCLARVPANRTLFARHQARLLALVMSQILDQGVAAIVADVLYECSAESDDPSS